MIWFTTVVYIYTQVWRHFLLNSKFRHQSLVNLDVNTTGVYAYFVVLLFFCRLSYTPFPSLPVLCSRFLPPPPFILFRPGYVMFIFFCLVVSQSKFSLPRALSGDEDMVALSLGETNCWTGRRMRPHTQRERERDRNGF